MILAQKLVQRKPLRLDIAVFFHLFLRDEIFRIFSTDPTMAGTMGIMLVWFVL